MPAKVGRRDGGSNSCFGKLCLDFLNRFDLAEVSCIGMRYKGDRVLELRILASEPVPFVFMFIGESVTFPFHVSLIDFDHM